MFYIITVTAVPGFFRPAGDCRASRVYGETTAADALRIARDTAANPRYRVVGIRVGNRPRSRILWVK